MKKDFYGDGVLGVSRYGVRISPYNSKWPELFDDEKLRISSALKDMDVHIEHIGSTSVPGLLSKPILDIMVGAESLELLAERVPALEKLGYLLRAKNSSHSQIFMALGPEEGRTHYLHLVKYNGSEWKKYIQFRDFLANHPELRDEYAHLKVALADKYADRRSDYSYHKEGFIIKVLTLAKEPSGE